VSLLDDAVNATIENKVRAQVQDQLDAVKHQLIRDSAGIDLEIEEVYGSLSLH
jgi:hypothetical protein